MSDRPTITTLPAGGRYDVSTLNSNFTAVRNQFDELVGRNGTGGSNNSASGNIDMNGNNLLNVGDVLNTSGAGFVSSIDYAEEWANKAEDSLVSVAAGGDGVDDYSSKHFSIKATAQVVLATAQVALAAGHVTTATNYATKVDGAVTGSDFSSKAWAIGGTNVTTTASRGAAKEWATTTGGAVDTSEYSSKEYAIGTTATSSKTYATKVDGAVTGSDFSSKAWAIGGTNVTSTGSRGAAKEWATTTGAAVDTSEYSAKEYAIGTTVAVGSAKDWAVLAEDSAVTGSSYSALHHAAKATASAAAAASSATAAASGQIYSTLVNQTGAALSPALSANGTYYLCNTASNDITVTLPAIGSGEGTKFAFQKTHASNSLIFARSGSDTLNGSASNITITDVDANIIFVADDNSPDNWVGTLLSQITAGSGITKTGSVLTLDLTQDQAWTGSQRSTPVTDNDGSFDMNGGNNFNWTPAGADVIEFTNETSGQGGLIYLVNGSGHTITKGSEVVCDANFLATVSAAGNYLISYYCYNGTNVAVANTLALT